MNTSIHSLKFQRVITGFVGDRYGLLLKCDQMVVDNLPEIHHHISPKVTHISV
jgi:hypothetical protein